MNISIITNALSDDYETSCRIMREENLRCAELQHIGGTPVEYCTVEDAALWKEISQHYEVTPICVTTHAFVGIPVHSIEAGDAVYGKHFALLKNAIAIAKTLGVGMVRTMTFTKIPVTFGGHGADQWLAGGNKAWPKFIELCRPLVKLAEDEGITLLVETCYNSMNTSVALTKRMIEEIGSGSLKLLWDPCNALYYGEAPTPEVYSGIKDILAHIHIKDAIMSLITSSVDFCPIGNGHLYPYLHDLAGALRSGGYEGYVSLEGVYRPDSGACLDGVHDDLRAMRNIFG